MGDIRIRKHVLDELAFEPGVEAAHIGAAVTDGIVTLSGTVRSFAEKRAAEIAAGRVKGVTAVVVSIGVLPDSRTFATDEEIARKVLQVLEWDAHIAPATVQVQVEDGWVTLSGNVDFYIQRHLAEEAVAALPCIKGITNRINMRPDVAAGDIEARVNAVLKRHDGLSHSDIQAKVFGGMVTLTGTVVSPQARQLAERATRGLPGVQWVEDYLEVQQELVPL